MQNKQNRMAITLVWIILGCSLTGSLGCGDNSEPAPNTPAAEPPPPEPQMSDPIGEPSPSEVQPESSSATADDADQATGEQFQVPPDIDPNRPATEEPTGESSFSVPPDLEQ